MWKQWVNAIIGLAVIAAPFLGLDAASLSWTLVVAGAVIAILSVWSAMEENSPEYHQRMLQHN